MPYDEVMESNQVTAFARHETQTAIVGLILQVLLARDGSSWIAQALDLDYATAGTSLEDVKRRFEMGLCETMQIHFNLFGNLSNFLHRPPEEEWQGLLKTADAQQYIQVSVHEFPKRKQDQPSPFPFPFGGIRYLMETMENQQRLLWS
jgi:hypothetical protein